MEKHGEKHEENSKVRVDPLWRLNQKLGFFFRTFFRNSWRMRNSWLTTTFEPAKHPSVWIAAEIEWHAAQFLAVFCPFSRKLQAFGKHSRFRSTQIPGNRGKIVPEGRDPRVVQGGGRRAPCKGILRLCTYSAMLLAKSTI